MKHVNKYLSLALALVLCLSLAACGESNEDYGDDGSDYNLYGVPDSFEGLVKDSEQMANLYIYGGAWTGEDGGALSAGQKQLLCITRIMLCLPPMLILDEATSSIDTRTEMRIQNAFAKLMQGRTSFIVAHRLSTIQHADNIIVLSHGKILEQGNHQELLAKHGRYYQLYTLQYHKEQLEG